MAVLAILATMCVGMFLVLLDVTVVNVALPSLASGLGADPAATQWIVDAYAVAIAGLLLAGGTVGDRIGHRRVVLAGLRVFGLASAACGLATGPGMLIAARAAQGVGAALLLPGSLAVITEAFPDRAARARALGIWAGVSSLALPAGPLLGGFLVASGGWRLVFLVNVPVVVAALVAVPRLVPAGNARAERRGDTPGTVLAAVGLAAAVFTVIDAGEHGLRPLTVAGLVVAVLCVAGFVGRERYASEPTLSELTQRVSVADRCPCDHERPIPRILLGGPSRAGRSRMISWLAQAIVTDIDPIRLIVISSRSPGAIGPTPGGAPVNSTSPGSSVITDDA
jgi:DHA2 family methylenomycin A resistance protein-like MFS transporter